MTKCRLCALPWQRLMQPHGPPLPAAVSGAVLPQHTQRALTACVAEVSDDRAPKDLDFLLRHAQALRPRTALGWVVSWVRRMCVVLSGHQGKVWAAM